MTETSAFVVLGDQLFPPASLPDGGRVFLAEDVGLCTHVRHHQHKLVLFLAAMRAHRDALRDRGFRVHYDALDPTGADAPYEEKLGRFVDEHRIDRLRMFEIEDAFFERRIRRFADERGLTLDLLETPAFLTPRARVEGWLRENRPFMADFYRWQRRRLGVLVDDDGEPIGGRWSFDDENRRPLPAKEPLPSPPVAAATEHVRAAIDVVRARFADHPGDVDAKRWWLPTTRRQALSWLRAFLADRFARFGPFEDALSTRDAFLFHSVLSPVLNLGLVTPGEVIDRALAFARDHDVPLNSLEGFVRQVIGWREFVRGVYRVHGDRQAEANHFGHTRRLTPAWWDGSTGLRPLDDVIAKCVRYGWAHHIERLMVAGNLMLLCEIDPREAHRWFMEMFVDSADWVMGPNVYGMALFSDGGIFATKPYICGSNYIRKMSDYPKPREPVAPDDDATWADVMDGLYWRFVGKHADFLSRNARMGRAVHTYERMDRGRRRRIVEAADRFIDRATA